MKSLNVRFVRLRSFAKVPSYGTEGAAACDLYASIEAPITIEPHKTVLIPTGIAIETERSEDGEFSAAALIYARSGLAIRHGISLANGVGVVDEDYRGEIMVGLINNSDVPYTVEPSERIAQLCFTPVFRAVFRETSSLDETSRGQSGFGSTGR